MVCFVTGGSGFIGANLVRALREHGHRVKALLRAGSVLRGLAGVDCEVVQGSLADEGVLGRALEGCDWCFHTAASYHLWLRDYATMYATNVQGTRAVIRAAVAARCRRIVYTSTVGCIGLPAASNGTVVASDEAVTLKSWELSNHYKRSKWQAEQVALELARQGAPVVVVNPSTPAGPGDAKPTPTGQVILDFVNRQMPAYVDTGLNWVHVRDVALGHIRAAERGRTGERYILANAQGNWTMKQTFEVLSRISGVPGPKRRIPYGAAFLAACMDEAVARFTGATPRASFAGVRMAKHKMYYNPAKAVRELGLPQTPPEEAMRDAVAWFRENGYVRV